MGFLGIIEIAGVDLGDELTQLHPVLHVVVKVREDCLHYALPALAVCGNGKILQRGYELRVHKAQQIIPFEALAVRGISPVAPAICFGDDGRVLRVPDFPIELPVVVHFQKKHPGQLLYALGVTVDTLIKAGDVTHPFHEVSNAHSCILVYPCDPPHGSFFCLSRPTRQAHTKALPFPGSRPAQRRDRQRTVRSSSSRRCPGSGWRALLDPRFR